MRRLTILVAVVASLYSAYWFIGANRVEAGTRDGLTQMAVDGWTVSQADVATRGYPSRFDTTVSDIALQSPDGNFAYTAPFVQAFALSYQPTKVIIAVADTQQFRFGQQVIDVTSTRLRASSAVAAGPSLPLKEATVEVAQLDLVSNFDWALTANEGILALRPNGNFELGYDVYLGIAKLQPVDGPPLVDIVFDSTIQLDRPIDRHLLADISPQIHSITVKSVQLVWEGTRLNGSGDLVVDPAGIPSGEIMLKTTNWQKLGPILVSSGLIAPNMQFAMLAIMQNLAGDDGALTLPLRFANGNMQLGPIPLGPAPRLR